VSRIGKTLWLSAALVAAFVTLPTPREMSGAWTPSASGVTAGLARDSISGVRGQKETVALQADMGSTGLLLGSYTAALQWDSTVVRLDSVRAGAFGAPAVNFVNGGEVRLTQVNTTGLPNLFTLVQLYFRFVNDTIGKRTIIQTTFSDLVATDFTDLRISLTTMSAVARILPPTVIVRFAPDSLLERVGFKPQIDLTADLAQASGVALGSYVAVVTWDPTIMVLDSVGIGGYAAPQINQVSSGELRLTAADGQGAGGAVALARLFFRFVNSAFPTQTVLGVSVSEMHAATSFADLLPGVTAKNGKAIIGGVLRGDIDIGGSVAALDAQIILQGVVGLALPPGAVGLPNGDADCNGALQAKDAQIVLNKVVGNDVSQFCAGRIQ
jgi:hypothetical protein